MSNRKKLMAAIAAMAFSTAAAHASSVLIGSWENQTDGWFDWPTSSGTNYNPPPTFPGGGEYTYNATGATAGNFSLGVNPGSGSYTQSLAIKLEYVTDGQGNSELQDFLNHTEFSIDETMDSSQWSNDGTYAVTQLIINAPGIGFDTIGLPNMDTRNTGFPGGYTASVYPGVTTGTMTWDYSSLLSQIGPNPSYVELVFVTVSDYSTVGTWYFDNARLLNPPVTTTWSNGAGDQMWTSAGNWSTGTPGAAGDNATFGTAITSPTTVNLNGTETLGFVNFSSGVSYNIAQNTTGSLTLDNGTAGAQINDLFGNHTISAPVKLNSNTTIAVGQANNVLTISGNITGSGGLTLTSTSVSQSVGTTVLTGTNSYTGGTTVANGTLVIGANGALAVGKVTITGGEVQLGTSTGAATITSLAISGNGTFDVNNDRVIINYGSGPDPIASIAALLSTGYNGGAWNGAGGITSTAAAATSGSYGVGFADSADPGNPAHLASGTLEIAYTLLGDADLNHIVNGIDFGIVAANFNQGVTSWDQGDFDYSHIVNGIDFGDLAANFNQGANNASDWAALEAFAAANGLLADVPEPASLGLLAIGAVGLCSRRRRSDRLGSQC